MNVKDFKKRLEENFSVNGVIGGHLQEILEAEGQYGEYFCNKFHGQSVLIDSFQSFYIETIYNANAWIGKNGLPKNAPNYASIFLYYIINFKSFRACENLLLKGYPLDGYALLRDLKDRALFLGAIIKKITTFPRIYGYENLKEASTKKDLQNNMMKRIKEEKRVLSEMIRGNSGLPKGIQTHLQKWEKLFNLEVHGSMFTYFLEGGDWLRGGRALSIGPDPKEDSMSMYMNRASEIGWLLTRLLPFLQPVKDAFGNTWSQRLNVLDNSFREMEISLSKLNIKIADAFIYFIDNKFNFSDTLHYFEATGN